MSISPHDDARSPGAAATILRARRRPPTPVPLTTLIGRDPELEAVRQMLDAGEVSLVTLLGPGGIGKTRFALEIARGMARDFVHGSAFVSLAAVREAALLVPTIAVALGVDEDPERPIGDLVLEVLVGQHLLLVIDNAEHLASEVGEWLELARAACPRLTVLVTSRVALNIAGEQRHVVQPLSLPRGEVITVESVSENAAATLFVQRARAVRPGFTVTEANAQAIVRICRRLDGMPLGIELAAARMAVLSPGELFDRLAPQLTVLTGGPRDLPARHQSMTRAIEWSYEMLPEAARSLFRRLAVFEGGFAPDAAPPDVLADLVDHSLVRASRNAGELRYTMLEPIREFGLDRLRERGEESAVRDAHADHVRQIGAAAHAGLKGHDQVRWLDRLETEHDNLRAAIQWLAGQGRLDDAMHLAADITEFRLVRGHLAEARTQLELLLAHPGGQATTLGRARALDGLAGMAIAQEQLAEAIGMLEEALAIDRASGDRALTGYVLQRLWLAFSLLPDPARAAAAIREAEVIAGEEGDLHLTCVVLCSAARAAHARNDREIARSLYEAAADVGRSAGDHLGLILALGHLGLDALDRRNFDTAERHFREKLELVAELDSRLDLASTHSLLAELARFRGDYDAAAAHLTQTLAATRQLGMRPDEALALLDLGRLACLRGELAQSMQHFRDALALLRGLDRKEVLVDLMERFARLAVAAGDMRRAARCVGAADAMLRELGITRIPSIWLDDLVALQDRMRAVLGDAGYQRAWSTGLESPFEESIADVLELDVGTGAGRPRTVVPTAASAAKLTHREVEVLRLVAEGKSNREIGDALSISLRTATSHVTNILAKLRLPTRTSAVAWAIRNGIA